MIPTMTIRNPIELYFHRMTLYHYYFFTFLFVAKWPTFWHVLNLIFLSPPMNFTCKGSKTVNQCPCKEPIWDRSVFTETVQTKYGLLCERAWLVSFSQSMLYVGALCGAFSFGFLSDKFGRLPTFSVSLLTVGISGCMVSFMPNAATFIFMRVFEGIGVGGAIVTGYVLCVEYCGTRYREMVTALYHIPINVSHMSMPGVSYLLRHCDHFQLALSLPMFLFVSMWYLCLESPKWLLDNGNVEKATKVMEKFLKFNGLTTENIRADMREYAGRGGAATQAKVKFWEIFKHKKLTINFACMAVIYFSCGMGYYGVSQYIGKMSGNIHANVAISGALLIPGTLTATFLLQVLGRRSFLMSTSFLSGILMIVVIMIPEHATLARVLIACICNTFFFMSFIIVFLYGVELFPTSIRNSVLGFLSVLSRVGQICAPPINSLPNMVSGLIFGSMAILGGLLCLPLPETKNMELPSSLTDSKTLPRRVSKLPEIPETVLQRINSKAENLQMSKPENAQSSRPENAQSTRPENAQSSKPEHLRK